MDFPAYVPKGARDHATHFLGHCEPLRKEYQAKISRGRGAKGDRVRAEIPKRNLPFSISEIEEASPGVSRDMVRLVLRTMKAEGLIAPTGKGRGARWISLANDLPHPLANLGV